MTRFHYLAREALKRIALADDIGEVSDADVAFYDENGWVEFEGFIAEELCAQILANLKKCNLAHDPGLDKITSL